MNSNRKAQAKDAILMETALRRLKKSPDFIVDVGVRAGTPPLYNAFPESHFLLVDPQQGGEQELQSRPKHYDFFQLALGALPGKMTLNAQGAHSSLLNRTPRTKKEGGVSRSVEIVRFEDLIEPLGSNATFGVKLDTEGFELEIIKGFGSAVSRIEFLICEVSIRNRFVNGYIFSDLMSVLNKKGFRFYNFLNIPKPKPKRFYDCLFLQSGDPLFDK